MQKILYSFLLIGFLGSFSEFSKAADVFGGEITWSCQGNGNYIFELAVYRDCNEGNINTDPQALGVWGHPSLSSIPMNFVSRTDLSPMCTAASGNNPIDCGTGSNGGSGLGAIEKILYQSNSISITGIPPAGGWHFTYQNDTRSPNINNLQNPSDVGITLSASMFEVPGATGSGCLDNSPRFLQDPYFIVCSGSSYRYNPGVIDSDLDSLHYSWGPLYNSFVSGSFAPPANPNNIAFASGYGSTNPTPGTGFNTGNQAANLNAQTGEITFLSNNTGNFSAKIQVDAYRDGQKIANVAREVMFIVTDCSGTNNAPQVTPPFNGNTSFETTVLAGDLVNFEIFAKDFETLQDGSPQSVTISASGLVYGTNFTDPNNGCEVGPCATLTPALPSTGVNGQTVEFNWQTSCDHLLGPAGEAKTEVPYYFVFKVQDDYCPIPKIEYVTVLVNVQNNEVIPGTEIKCITTNDNGDISISWEPVTDPAGTFERYEVNNTAGTTYGVLNDITDDNFTIIGGVGSVQNFVVSTLSGCNGNTRRDSDTLSNIYLNLNNPGNGEAVLEWNKPSPNQLNYFNDYYLIYKEFPLGNWELIDSVPYNTTDYHDTITVCQEQINYRIVLPTDNCDFKSNIDGDVFKDNIVPDIPIITNVDIDTLTNDITVVWSENSQSDTYGYVVYQTDPDGNLVEIDTVWGKPNTSYTHYQAPDGGPYQYSVAAFDSCFTSNVPPTYQTSAKANPHQTIFLNTSLDVCDRQFNLSWTPYDGFSVDHYLIFVRVNNNSWEQIGQTSGSTYAIEADAGDEIITTVQAVSNMGITSFSNVDTLNFAGASQPEMSYLAVASVVGDRVEIKHRVSLGDGISKVELERYSPRLQEFKKIDEVDVDTDNDIVFSDTDVEVFKRSYTYRTRIIDTCGQPLGYSNIGRTMHLKVITDEANETHTLQWTPYAEFIGEVYQYEVYRAIDGVYDEVPLASFPNNQRTFTDQVINIGDNDDGKICYFVIAHEGGNEFAAQESSYSNEVCPVIPPMIYIPNAFTVGGKNPIFKPETRQRKIADYLFEIYDRYGRVIFSTTNPDEGWNGEIEGQLFGGNRIASEGVYVYRLALRDGNNIEVVKYGHVTLLNYTEVKD